MSLASSPINQTARAASTRLIQRILHLDMFLLTLLALLTGIGIVVLYSAFGGQIEPVKDHLARVAFGVVLDFSVPVVVDGSVSFASVAVDPVGSRSVDAFASDAADEGCSCFGGEVTPIPMETWSVT